MVTYDSLVNELLTARPWRRAAAPFSLVKLAGPDAPDFLQRLCSQDVVGMAVHECRPAAFLDAKGKVQMTCYVGRAVDAFWLEVQSEQVERLLAWLERYHFNEKLTFVRQAWTCADWIGGAWPAGSVSDNELLAGAETVRFAIARRSVRWLRVHAATPQLPAEFGGTEPTGELAEAVRMLAGFVRVGVDTEPTTLALEADLDDHCSTTKGCYTGQEIVARIHTYGHVNRRLCLLHLADGPAITAPTPLHEPEDDVPVGRVMAAVRLAERGFRLGFGYLPKDFQAAGTVLRLPDGSAVQVVGTPLPGC
ncbi:MAG: hypothetical protein IPK26_07015 [Planctomycetes bacterium]|nr:hypothetical protein [Planctomycetota bacterium]